MKGERKWEISAGGRVCCAKLRVSFGSKIMSHFFTWLVNNDQKKIELERLRGLRLIYAARTATDGNLEDSTIASVTAACRSWVCDKGLSSPQSAQFSNEVVRWTGSSFAAYGTVEITTLRGKQVRHWYVDDVNADIENAELGVVFADMLSFDPATASMAALQKAAEED
jgi:hypothetical protein